MDLNRVSAFVRVVLDGSFTAAARSLGLPKSSVSRSVAQLEQDLGIRLLHRTTRKLALTDAGSAFYERVSRALGDIDEATSAAADSQSELRGPVRVTAPTDIGIWALAPMLAEFTRSQPGIRVELSLSNRVVDMVAEGFDLAVRAGPLRDSSLIARRVGELRSVLYASPAYLQRRGTPKDIGELAGHDAVVFRPTNGKSSWTMVSPAGGQKTIEMTGPLACDDMSFAREAILAGAGIGVVPEFLCGAAEEEGEVVRVLPEWSVHGSVLHLAYPSARYVPQRVVVLRDFLANELASLGKTCAEHRAMRESKRGAALAAEVGPRTSKPTRTSKKSKPSKAKARPRVTAG